MRKIFILSLLCGITFFGFSQVVLFEDNSVIISYDLMECDGPSDYYDYEYAILSLENKTENGVEVSFNIYPYYNGNCHKCDDNSNPNELANFSRTFRLNPQETIVTNCSDDHINVQKITFLSDLLNYDKGVKLTSLIVKDVNVN